LEKHATSFPQFLQRWRDGYDEFPDEFHCPSVGIHFNIAMKFALLLAVAALTVVQAGADPTNAPAPLRIGALEAKNHYADFATVTGAVAQVTFRPSVVFVNFDKPHPDAPFTAVIFTKDTNSFGDLKSLEGKSVEVCGQIKEFKGSAEMVLTNAGQLTIVTNSAPAQ
jgi:hypothetical protein